MPTSMTTAPGLTMSAVSTLRLPTAATTMSACRVWWPRSGVALWQMVTVALACSSSIAIGLPTMLLRPITTACLPRGSHADGLEHLHAAVGRAGLEARQADISAPALAT
jgi:hypothetical protein